MTRKFSELQAKMSPEARKRSDRRYRSLKIALRRWASLGETQREGQHIGWFRKWNLTCQCRMCQLDKRFSTELQRLKDERRNPNTLPD